MSVEIVGGKVILIGRCDRCQAKCGGRGEHLKTPSGITLCMPCVVKEMANLTLNNEVLRETVQRLAWAVAVDGARQDSEGLWHPRSKLERGPFESEEYRAAAQLGMVRPA